MLIVSSTIHAQPAAALVNNAQLERARTYSPALFADATATIEGVPEEENAVVTT